MIRRETWIVLAVFALALIGLIWWQRSSGDSDAAATPAASVQADNLFDLEGAALQAVRLERVGDRVVEFVKDESGAWQISWPANQQADSAALESTLAQLAGVSVVEKMASAPALGEMGLEPPLHRLLLTLDNGRQLVANIGRQTPTGGGYYVLANQNVYIVSNFSLDPILGLVDSLPLAPTPTPPTPYPAIEETPGPTASGDATPTANP